MKDGLVCYLAFENSVAVIRRRETEIQELGCSGVTTFFVGSCSINFNFLAIFVCSNKVKSEGVSLCFIKLNVQCQAFTETWLNSSVHDGEL